MVWPPTVMRPGAVSTKLRESNAPLSSAMAAVNGLSVEPGSNTSVTLRLRNAPPVMVRRSLGLNCGELTMAMISPLGTANATTLPPAASCARTAASR